MADNRRDADFPLHEQDRIAMTSSTNPQPDRESDREALLRIAAVASFGVRLSRREIAALKRIAERTKDG